MGEDETAVGRPVPLPRLERAVGFAAEIAVLALLPAWAVWLVTCRLGSLPTWSWVVAVAGPAAVAAWRARRGPNRQPADSPVPGRSPGPGRAAVAPTDPGH